MKGEDSVKVLYVAGWGRSGSTILGNILGEAPSFFHAGELVHVWRSGLLENRLCGCGAPFRECEVWTGIFDRAFGGMNKVDPLEMMRLHAATARTRHLPLMLLPHSRLGSLTSKESNLKRYAGALQRLYVAIQDVTGCKVIVDSSKYPSYGSALQTLSLIDLYVVHIVRDSRATAYSWLREKPELDKGTPDLMEQYSPIKSSVLWGLWNVATEMLWRRYPERYMLLRYENFVVDPQTLFKRMVSMVREQPSQSPFVAENRVRVGGSHTVSGNPDRFRTGTVELRSDEEWRRKMKKRDRVSVTALTWPLLWRYGYL